MRRGEPVLRRRFASAGCRPGRYRSVTLVAALIGAIGLLAGCVPAPVVSIASTGDSIARGFDACGLLRDCPAVSYATGTAPNSASLYRRLLGGSPRLAGHDYNDAEVGARASDLYVQMALATWQQADVVTVLIGANDACASSVGAMTPVGNFQASVQDAFGLFFSNRPGARIVLSSIPSIYRVWQVGHTNSRARAIWKAAGLCPSMLANPTSNSPADNLRRFFVTLQINKYNAALAAVCRKFSGCRWDGGALGRYPFKASELSAYDYFHPSPAGQKALSVLAWNAYSRRLR
jgi:hypothetical protein